MRVDDLELLATGLDAHFLVGGVQSTQIESELLNGPITWGGILGGPQSVISQTAPNQLGTSSFIAVGSSNHVENHAKVALSDTSNLLSIDAEGTPFLISGASGDGAIGTLGIGTDGAVSLIDTIGVEQKLWLSGMDDLIGVVAVAIDCVAIAATNSSSVSLAREVVLHRSLSLAVQKITWT